MHKHIDPRSLCKWRQMLGFGVSSHVIYNGTYNNKQLSLNAMNLITSRAFSTYLLVTTLNNDF